MSLIYISLAWVAGIYLGSKLALPWALVFTSLIPLSFLFFYRRHLKTIILLSVCFCLFFGGALYYQASLPPDDTSHLQFYNDQEIVEIKGIIKEEPEIRDKTVHIILSASEIKDGESWRELSGDALIFAPRYADYGYGDELLVTGELKTPPQLGDFDYEGYLARQGIYSTMLYPEIDLLDSGKGFKPLAGIYWLKNHLSQNLSQILPEPQASLAQGIILGIRYNIPSEVRDNFNLTGTAHLLAISGLHLSIIAGILLSIGVWLFGRRRYTYIWLALGVIWLYGLITGFNLPIVRGAIMASLFLIAELLGRQRTAATSLAFAAAIMVAFNPQVLWDAAFQLSFLAMAGLIFIAPPLMNLGRKAVGATLGKEGTGVSLANITTDSIAVTLAATIAVWPLIAHYFGIVSLVGPFATLLALPVVPAIILTGGLAGFIGLIYLPLAKIIAWVAWLFISYMLWVINGFASLPLPAVEVGGINVGIILAYYTALGIAIWFISYRNRLTDFLPRAKNRLKQSATKSTNFFSRLPAKWVIPPLLIIAILVSVTAATMPNDNLKVSFLDVGQGDAILIEKGNQQVLIDGGPSPQKVATGLGDKLPFWDRTIELVVLTHPNSDHLSGLTEVVKRYEVKQVLYPDLDYSSPLYEEWLELLDEENITCTMAQAGQRIDLGDGVIMTVLNPQPQFLTGTDSDTDNNGVVLKLSADKVSFLLTADIRWETEFELIAKRSTLASTVLKIPHHGSNTSSTSEFLAIVNPEAAVISAGADNSFGHPNTEVIARLEEVLAPERIYRTDEQGTIEFITDGERLWVKTKL